MGNDVKWIKLSTDIFNNRKIKQIESMPDGDAIIVIWFKLLVLAGEINDNGCIYFTQEIPYTDQLLSTQFNKPIQTVQLALTTFEKFKMIEIIEDLIRVSNWEKYQNVNGMDRIKEQNRIRQQRWRDNQKNITDSNATVTLHNGTDIDKEVDIEEDKKEEVVEHNEEPPVVTIELIDGTLYNVTQSEIDYWHSVYPAVDVLSEMRRISAWNHSNPKRRKTRGGIKRHINTWLGDKQNHSRNVYNGSSQQYVPVPDTLPVDYEQNPFKG